MPGFLDAHEDGTVCIRFHDRRLRTPFATVLVSVDATGSPTGASVHD